MYFTGGSLKKTFIPETMSSERHPQPAATSGASRAAAEQRHTAGVALPAVNPLQLKDRPLEPGIDQPPPLQRRQPASMPAPGWSGKPVIQMALKTKKGIAEDQIKWQVTIGLISVAEKTGEQRKYAEKLIETNLIDRKYLKKSSVSGFNQETFWAAHRDKDLKLITLDNLEKNGLLLEGIKLTESIGKWTIYNTVIDESLSEAKGLGGKTPEGHSVTTKIKWSSVHPGAQEGQKVTALILGPDHPLGTVPGDAAKTRAAALGRGTYRAGHLLNDHLGGPGTDNRNITAIPNDVNSEQSEKVERKVKQRVNSNKEIVFYEVEATYDMDKFTGVWYANNLRSAFGTYKKGTRFDDPKFSDFDSVPRSDLKDFYEHNLPIQSPTNYQVTKKGYKTSPGNDNKYANGGSRKPVPIGKISKSSGKATLSVNATYDLVLKDSNQVKLEFISYAIFHIPIKKLRKRIRRLEKQGVDTDRLSQDVQYKEEVIREQAGEIARLEEEIKQNEELLKKLRGNLQEINKKYKEDIEYDPANEDLKLKALLEKIDEKLNSKTTALEVVKKERDIYKARARDLAQLLGYYIGKNGVKLRKIDDPTGSPTSRRRLKKGYRLGREEYKQGARANKEEKEKEDAEKLILQGQAYASSVAEKMQILGYRQGHEIGQLPEDVAGYIADKLLDEDVNKHFRKGVILGMQPLLFIFTQQFNVGLADERDFSSGQNYALTGRYHARRLGHTTGIKHGQRDADPGAALLSELFPGYVPDHHSRAYDAGFRAGLRQLIAIYESGLETGIRDRRIAPSRHQQHNQTGRSWNGADRRSVDSRDGEGKYSHNRKRKRRSGSKKKLHANDQHQQGHGLKVKGNKWDPKRGQAPDHNKGNKQVWHNGQPQSKRARIDFTQQQQAPTGKGK